MTLSPEEKSWTYQFFILLVIEILIGLPVLLYEGLVFANFSEFIIIFIITVAIMIILPFLVFPRIVKPRCSKDGLRMRYASMRYKKGRVYAAYECDKGHKIKINVNERWSPGGWY